MNCHSRTYSKTPHLVSTTVSAVDLSLLPFLVFFFLLFIHETQLLPHSIPVKPPFRATSISYSGGVLDTWPNIRGRHQVCVYSLFTFCLSALLLVNPSLTCHCTQHFTVSYVVQSPDGCVSVHRRPFVSCKKPEPSRAWSLLRCLLGASLVRVTCTTRHATPRRLAAAAQQCPGWLGGERRGKQFPGRFS